MLLTCLSWPKFCRIIGWKLLAKSSSRFCLPPYVSMMDPGHVMFEGCLWYLSHTRSSSVSIISILRCKPNAEKTLRPITPNKDRPLRMPPGHQKSTDLKLSFSDNGTNAAQYSCFRVSLFWYAAISLPWHALHSLWWDSTLSVSQLNEVLDFLWQHSVAHIIWESVKMVTLLDLIIYIHLDDLWRSRLFIG